MPKINNFSILAQPSIFSLFICFFLFAFFISLQFLFLPDISISYRQILSSLFGTGDHLLYALACSLLITFLHRIALPIPLLLVISFILGFVLVVDSVFYQVYYQHLSLSAYESGTSFYQLLGSFYSELGIVQILNIIICLLIQIPIFKILKQNKLSLFPDYINWQRKEIYQLITIIVLTMIYSYVLTIGNLHYNPLVRIGFSLFKPSNNIYIPGYAKQNATSNNDQLANIETLKKLSRPIYASARSYKNISRKDLNNKTSSLPTNRQKKNIILVVLESIGGVNLFPDDQLVEENTPFLASIKKHSTLFNSIYTYYPATTRAHVPIQTGGLSITYESTRQLQYPYMGSTLVSSVKGSGYNSALFSAQKLDFGNLDKLYQQMGFDYYFDPIVAGKQFINDNKAGSWGVFETAILPKTFDWIDKSTATNTPFFLEFFTSSSHHPYVYPGSEKERTALSRYDRYKKSLLYTDKVLQQIWNNLKQRQLLENTIIYITGDHGQAFGRRHKKNFTHRNYIYEENVRSFLLRIDASQQQHLVSDRPGSIGDILPTILADTAIDKQNKSSTNDFLGQNLLDADYQLGIQFFHKHQMPAQWGLRDGQWKFISRQTGIEHAELYNLQNDPLEQHNLANKYPERIKQYQKLTATWSSAMQQNFSSQLKANNHLSLSPDELSNKGPKQLRIGIKPKDSSFEKLKIFHPDEDIVAQVYRIPDDIRHDYFFVWRSPSGKETRKRVKVESDWERVYNDLDYPRSLEEGRWQLKVITNEDKVFEQYFTVSKKAKLIDPRYRAMGPKQISLGYLDNSGKFHKQEIFHPFEQILVQGKGLAFPSATKLDMYWISPSNKTYRQVFTMEKNRSDFSSQFKKAWPLEAGLWKVSIKNNSNLLAETKVKIDKNARLYNSSIVDSKERVQQIKQKFIVNRTGNKALNAIVIMDNNINKAHMQIFGYHRDNMPNLYKLLKHNNLLTFSSIYSADTREDANSFPLLLPEIEDSSLQGNDNPTLIDILNASAIQTIWFGSKSSSKHEQFYTHLVNKFYPLPELNKELDTQALLLQISDILKTGNTEENENSDFGKFIFIHLPATDNSDISGNTCFNKEPYNKSLTEAFFGRNANTSELSQKINCHDNRLVKIDSFISDLTLLPELQQTPSMIWYGANYTPHIFEKVGHLNENLSNNIRDIPLAVWFSNTYQHYFSEKLALVKQHINAQFSSNMLYDFLLGLTPVISNMYNPVNDIGNLFFKEKLIEKGVSDLKNDDETYNKFSQQKNIRKLITAKLDSRLLPHRINSIGKLKHILHDGYHAYEIDVLFHTDSKGSGFFEVGHDEKALSGLSLKQFLLHNPNPVKKIWFDIKNITPENIDAVLTRLNELQREFSIKNYVIIESDIISAVFNKIADAGYYTSYYLPTEKLLTQLKNNDQNGLEVNAQLIVEQIKQQRVKAISFDSKLYTYVKSKIEPRLLKTLDYHTWDMTIPFKDPDFIKKISQQAYYLDSKVKTILLAYYSEFTL